MKKLKQQLVKAMAKFTRLVAVKGAGLASDWGWYQPKVPDKLCK